MQLSNELLSQFAKATKDIRVKKQETIAYGTIVESNGEKYVQLDGSEILTPMHKTTNVVDGERVPVMIKNHMAIVTGNFTSPAIRSQEFTDTYEVIDQKFQSLDGKFESTIDKTTFDNLNKVVQENSTWIKESSEKITLGAKEVVGNAINGLQVGATNILRKSKELTLEEENVTSKDLWVINNPDIVSTYVGEGGFYRAKLYTTGQTSDTWGGIRSAVERLPSGWQGRQVTLSAWVYSASWAGMEAGGSPSVVWNLCLSKGDATRLNYTSRAIIKSGVIELADNVYSDVDLVNNKWVRVSTTFTLSKSDIGTGDGDFDANTHIFVQFYLRRNGAYLIYAPKLEFGNKSTSWSPAPEDVDASLEGLDGRISEAELAITSDSIMAKVSEHKTYKKDLGSKLNSDTYNDDKEQLDKDLGDLTERISEAELAITSDSIMAKVSEHKTYKKDIDIQIGGTNYLLDSKRDISNGYLVATYYFSETRKPKDGETVTIRVWGTLGEGRTKFGIWNTNGYIPIGQLTNNGDGTHSGTFKWTVTSTSHPENSVTNDTQTRVQVYALPNDDSITTTSTITKIKMESGNRATDWSPAPEDAEDAIAGLVEWKKEAEVTIEPEKIVATVRGSTAYTDDLASKLDGNTYDKFIEAYEARIELEDDQIEMLVNRTVGATNYLLDSDRSFSSNSYYMKSYYFSEKMKPKAGDDVTIRIWGSLGEGRTKFGIWNTNGYIHIGYLTDNGDGTYSGTFTWTNTSANYPEHSVTDETQTCIQVYALPNDSAITSTSTITKIKMEIGNSATDWSAHPEELNAGSSIRINENEIDMTTSRYNVNILSEDGEKNMLSINEDGAVFQSMIAPNVTPRYDGPAVLYVDPNATSAQVETGAYYRSIADAFSALSHKWINKTITINLAAGMIEYGVVTLQGVSGGCFVQIVGDSSKPAKLIGRLNFYFDFSPISVAYMSIDTSTVGIYSQGCQTTTITYCSVIGPGSSVIGTRGISSARGSNVLVGYSEIYNCERSLYGETGGTISAYECKGNCRVGVNRSTLYLSGTMPCDSTTWAAFTWAGQVITQDITVDQGDISSIGSGTASSADTVSYDFTYSDSYCSGWSYFSDEDVRQGYVGKRIYGTIWFNASTIKSALSGKTINKASLRLHMQTGYGRGVAVSVQLYGTNTAYSGRSAAPALTTSYGTIGTTNPGETNEITIPTQVINDIVSGKIVGLVLYSDDAEFYKDRTYSKNYARFDGSTSGDTTTRPRLTVSYS